MIIETKNLMTDCQDVQVEDSPEESEHESEHSSHNLSHMMSTLSSKILVISRAPEVVVY